MTTTAMTSTEIVTIRRAKVRPPDVLEHVIRKGLILLGRNQFNGDHVSIGPHGTATGNQSPRMATWAVWDGYLCVPDDSHGRAANHFRRLVGRDGLRRALRDRLNCLEY